MGHGVEQIERPDSTSRSGVERADRGGVIASIRAEFGRPPRRGLRSAVAFALSCALVTFTAVGYAVTGDELQLPLIAALAGQWFMFLAEVLPVRLSRAAPALRALALVIFVGSGIGWWLA